VRASKTLLLCVGLVGLAWPAAAGSSKVIKVLPHFLDQQGRIALNPSLYARDAYQAHLRNNSSQRAGLQFDVQWRGRGEELKLRLELRGAAGAKSTTATLEETVTGHGLFAHWSKLKLTDSAWKNFGDLSAWRATLWSGDNIVAEQKSFLW
jgi:hypothetical protein